MPTTKLLEADGQLLLSTRSPRYRVSDEPLAFGLVRELIADEKLADLAAGLGADIAQAPREALVRTKSKIIRRAEISLVTTLQL